jgi:hypothetical protein
MVHEAAQAVQSATGGGAGSAHHAKSGCVTILGSRLTEGIPMSKPSIADAVDNIENLLAVMDDAYWEASSIDKKDCIYSIIALLHEERAELAKLSIQDHDLPYEPVSSAFKRLQPKLNELRRNLDDVVMRARTAARLEAVINKVVAMIA